MPESIRSYPILESLPLWPERDVCRVCGRQRLPNEEPWPECDVCPECAEEDDDE